jgi:predicted DNA binding protein
MSVIAELRIAGSQFELGRILGSMDGLEIELETMVPLRQRTVPFVLVRNDVSDTFEETVRAHPSVERITEVERRDGEVRYALDWTASQDRLFGAIEGVGAQLLAGRADGGTWAFELWVPSHDALSEFKERCEDAQIEITVDRIYTPTKSNEESRFGLTDTQRETLVRAVEEGYYDIPRRMSTDDLAEVFDISDQATTERLRRAIVGFTEHALITSDHTDEE